ncbi:hypothetical protein SAMN04487898_102432 [Pedobacter sp. ok626]|uniref:DUF4397 domain-containing protein n=1 Tax=Pedobacter sp. ok626 TaxID=1761882 RepID=UPI00088F2708|nr:DUF4397 domain-containing protein [Pedobacter sp. ok626]SDJ39014.1 hypothetical protein SAMN04487898_102432 [Pedobacter sp. ok626]
MRKFRISAWFILVSILFMACKKEDSLPVMSSLILVNAVPGSAKLVINLNGTTPGWGYSYSGAAYINYGVFEPGNKLTTFELEQPLGLFQYPDTTATSKPLFDLQLQLKKGSINSLFLTGTVDHPDHLLVTDVPPFHNQRDSTFGIRFANLSYQSKPVSIYLIDDGVQKEVDELAYKQVTGYMNYPALAQTGDYKFEFRDKETQKVLATYEFSAVNQGAMNRWRYRNFTLALKGLPGAIDAAQAQSPFLIDNY